MPTLSIGLVIAVLVLVLCVVLAVIGTAAQPMVILLLIALLAVARIVP